eukprot:gene5446-5680_t
MSRQHSGQAALPGGAICLALNIGNPGDVVTPEAMEAAGRSFQQRTCFRENPFADSIDKYLQHA